MGKRRRRARQSLMWVAAQDLPRSAAHPFYTRLNQVLEGADFDADVERRCQRFYATTLGRPSLAPGRYFRLLLLGYFEGLDSERAIAWRAADSLSVRQFLGLELHEAAPDHSTVSRTRRLIDVETHQAVFTWVLQRIADAGLVQGHTIGIDATTLEANAALRSIVRRDTGETYDAFLTRLAQASGIETPTREDLARLDRERPKKGSNAEWQHPHDPDARVTKMKDGRTHLGHKAEHGVDLETGAIVAVTVHEATAGDTATLPETLTAAAEQVEEVRPDGDGPQEAVADKGYHSNQTLVDLEAVGIRRVHLRTGAQAPLLAWPVGGARRRLSQSSPAARRPWPTLAAPSRRTRRAAVRASLSHRPAAPHPCPRAQQHSQARADPCGGFQSRAPDAHAHRRRHPSWPSESARGAARRPDPCPQRSLDARQSLRLRIATASIIR